MATANSMNQLRKLGWRACRATQWVAELQSEAVTQCGTTSTTASTCGTAWAVLPQPGVGQVDGCTSSKRAAALQARHSLHNMHGGWRHVQCCIWSWAPLPGLTRQVPGGALHVPGPALHVPRAALHVQGWLSEKGGFTAGWHSQPYC